MSRVRRARRGAVLAELMVAFTLAMLVAAGAVAVMAGAERYLRRSGDLSDGRRALREAESALAAELLVAAADSLRVLGDTAASFLGLVGTSVACVTAPGELVLPPATASATPPYTVWRVNPASGDLVFAFDSTAGGTWRTAIVDSVAVRTDGAGCTPVSGFLSAADSASRYPVTRIFLSPALALGVGIGAPVRLLRWGRYVLTRGADRTWSLSYRDCLGALVCGPSQPVVGPLAAASDTGLAFSVDPLAAHIHVTIRTAPHGGAARETRKLNLTLRNRAAGWP